MVWAWLFLLSGFDPSLSRSSCQGSTESDQFSSIETVVCAVALFFRTKASKLETQKPLRAVRSETNPLNRYAFPMKTLQCKLGESENSDVLKYAHASKSCKRLAKEEKTHAFSSPKSSRLQRSEDIYRSIPPVLGTVDLLVVVGLAKFGTCTERSLHPSS
jgi:hypothetical protein